MEEVVWHWFKRDRWTNTWREKGNTHRTQIVNGRKRLTKFGMLGRLEKA